MKPGIQETDKSFMFKREIGKEPVKVSLKVGWIWIEEFEQRLSWFGQPNGKKEVTTMTLTTEDARNLIACMQELLPKQESDGKANQGSAE